MKTIFCCLTGLLALAIVPYDAFAQCAGGSPAFSITYDSIVYGNGNEGNIITFPKFDPSVGTLLSADLKSVVNLSYAYTLQNTDVATHSYKIKILRTDDISSTALDPSSVSALNQTPFVTTTLASLQQLNYGPAHMSYTINNSVSDGRLINFMGAGTVDFDYETGTSAAVSGPLPYVLNFSAANDTTHFSVTYRYCTTSLLSADLLFFTALAQSGENVLLNWRQVNVESNRVYNLQLSTDGQHFNNVAAVKENSTGAYAYTYLHNAGTRLYFRIQEQNASGEIKYSVIRIIDPPITAKTAVQVFPTLYTGGNLQFIFPYKGDWQISFYSAEGKVIAASRQAAAYNTQLELPSNIGNGMYTAEVVDMRNQQKQFTRIVVRR